MRDQIAIGFLAVKLVEREYGSTFVAGLKFPIGMNFWFATKKWYFPLLKYLNLSTGHCTGYFGFVCEHYVKHYELESARNQTFIQRRSDLQAFGFLEIK